MALNITLKVAIVQSGQAQVEIAKAARMHESKLSKIVNGHLLPTEDEAALIAAAIGRQVSELFPEVAA